MAAGHTSFERDSSSVDACPCSQQQISKDVDNGNKASAEHSADSDLINSFSPRGDDGDSDSNLSTSSKLSSLILTSTSDNGGMPSVTISICGIENDPKLGSQENHSEDPKVDSVRNRWGKDSPSTIAKRLQLRNGIYSEDIWYYLSRKTEYGQKVAAKFMALYDFTGMSMDHALRMFLQQVHLDGETHDRARVLEHFANRYYEANQGSFVSADACNALCFAAVLLNTDLHNPNISKRMTFKSFAKNIAGQHDGKDFPTTLLKELYYSIKREPLPTAGQIGPQSNRHDSVTSMASFPTLRRLSRSSLNEPVLWKSSSTYSLPPTLVGSRDDQSELDVTLDYQDSMAPIAAEGRVKRKLLIGPSAKRLPLRGWGTFYAQIRGSMLFFFKEAKGNLAGRLCQSLSLRHSFARLDSHPQHTFLLHLTTHSFCQYYLATETSHAMANWVKAINQSAAVFSAPPMPAPIGSHMTSFRWPVQSLAPTTLDKAGQLKSFREKIVDLQDNLKTELESISTDGHGSTSRMLLKSPRLEFLQYELQRYSVYCAELNSILTGKEDGVVAEDKD